MRIALIGRPNCGKSTLFNQVAGYKAETGNFHGTTVTYTESKVRVLGEVVDLVDLPGTYVLGGSNPAEKVSHDYLGDHPVDVIINVIDATFLAQSLELTLELLRLDKPVLLAMNMMDEVARLGIKLDGPALEKELGVRIVPVVASKGRGIKALFLEAKRAAEHGILQPRFDDFQDDPYSRHKAALQLSQRFAVQGQRTLSWRDRLDDIFLHPAYGYVALAGVLLLFFQAVYGVGQLIEPPLLALFDSLITNLNTYIDTGNLLGVLLNGVLQGVMAGFAIVLPYLFPFLLGLGFLEDVGYLPRIAFLMDSLMHRIGLHGKAIVPFILGYGCNVPAIMSTRTLEDSRERFIAAALSTLVPCAARLVVVFGLVAFYLGPLYAFGLYLLNLLIIALTGRILTRLLPENTPGMILEMPPYRIPTLRAVANKAWFRIREFIVEAWPTLIFGSAALGLLVFFDIAKYFNWMVRPITWLLDLPAEVGVPLIFGVLRKELSLIMLGQALGNNDYSAVLSNAQLFTFTVFVVFFVPCVATLVMLKRELGSRQMVWVTLITIIIAMGAGLAARIFGLLL